MHVIADAATSVLAIVALAGGWFYGWSRLDPVMGIVGAALVAVWAKNLLSETGKVLLDREMDHPVVEEIREAVETGPDAGETRIADLHVWRVGKQSYACALSLVTHDEALTAQRVREQLAQHEESEGEHKTQQLGLLSIVNSCLDGLKTRPQTWSNLPWVAGPLYQRAVVRRFSKFNLQRGVMNAETVLQFLGSFRHEVVSRLPAGHDQVRRQSSLSGAHPPDV